MKKYLLFVLLLFAPFAWGQDIDTTSIEKIQTLESQIDSLRQTIRALDNELQRVKQNMVEGETDVDEILALLDDEEDIETVPEDQRSRRKRVDALLKAITQRPGQLRFNGGATTILQGSLRHDIQKTAGVGSFNIYAHTAFGPHTLLFINLEAVGGNGPDDQFQTLSGLNGGAGSTQDSGGIDRMTVYEAWVEFTVLGEVFTVTAGKIDLTNYFDNNASANDETMQFISNSFVNSSAFAVPSNSPGIRFRTTLFRRFYLQFGLASADNSGLNLFDKLYTIGSTGFRVLPDTEWEANIRFYAYQHPMVENALGYGLSFDEIVLGAYNIFARYSKNEDDLADWFSVTSAWSAGTRFVRQLIGQTTVLGIAYGETHPDQEELKSEKLLEIYARRQLNKWVHVSPHLQLVWNTAGTSERLAILGFRTHFNF